MNHLGKIIASLALGVVSTLVLSCTTETHPTGPSTIRMKSYAERFKDVSLRKIYLDGRFVGRLRRSRLLDGDSNDYNDHYYEWVEDENGEKLGFVTDTMQAFRFRAHGAPEMVANHPRLANDVRAILGYNSGKVVFEAMK